jgi:quercetin dioxygenase-like cupin family protein
MAELFNQDSVNGEELSAGARRQRLIDNARVNGSQCLFDRLTLDAGAAQDLQVPDSGILWVQLVLGSAELRYGDYCRALAELDAFFLPPGSGGELTSSNGAELISLAVPDAAKMDPSLASVETEPQFVDLSTEPLLQSEHDERTRIYVATAKLFGTTAMAGELVIFPPGTTSQNHHHVGAEHFQYVLRGSATVFLNETPHRIRAGDLVYKYDYERHYCQNDDDGELAFVEFFVPGEWETVWANPEASCTWSPTGQNIKGGAPSREIASHTSDGTVYEDV